jgi:uncharacterized membrane protein YdfJ with MMPL/SSD domain
VIFAHRRAIAWSALALVAVAAVLALPVFGELGNENDFDDPSAEAVSARNAVTAATGASAAPSVVALVRLGDDGEARIARVARALRDPGVASVVAYARGGDRRLLSRDGRSSYLLATFKRIKELHDAGLSNEEAVALGLQRTGRIVTFAAALMVIAIGCFVTASIIFIKQLGLGVAVAVLIDATIVRALLVPALMRLLGDWNWWVPRPLARLLPA